MKTPCKWKIPAIIPATIAVICRTKKSAFFTYSLDGSLSKIFEK